MYSSHMNTNGDLQIFDWFLGAFERLQKAIFNFVMSVCPYFCTSKWNDSVPTGLIFMIFHIRLFFEILSRKFKFH